MLCENTWLALVICFMFVYLFCVWTPQQKVFDEQDGVFSLEVLCNPKLCFVDMFMYDELYM